MGDAKRLVELSGLTDPKLKNEAVKYIVNKKVITRPVKKLASLLGHPCSLEQIEKINAEFTRKYESYSRSGNLGVMGPDGKTIEQSLLESMGQTAGIIIGEGFDVAFKDNLNINSVTGEVTVKRDATGQPDTRFLKCAAAEVTPGMPAGESDPYKGSQQGLGRTRKQKKRSKKTLRRRKVRRNMH